MSLYRSPEMLASWFQKKIFKAFLYYECIGANEPWGVANLDPKGMIGRVHVGEH